MEDDLMRPPPPAWASRILACLLPRHDVEAIMGDLMEEHLLRSWSTRSSPARWYWGQIVRSIPVLLWSTIQRGGLPATLAAAFGACIIQAIVELTGKYFVLPLIADAARVPFLLTLSLTTLMVLGYFATRIRPGAAALMAALVLAAVAIQLLTRDGDGVPLWLRVVSLVGAPSAAFAGGALCHSRRRLSGGS